MCYSAANFAKARREGEVLTVSENGPRALAGQAPVAQMFKGRFWDDSGPNHLNEEDLRKIHLKSQWTVDVNPRKFVIRSTSKPDGNPRVEDRRIWQSRLTYIRNSHEQFMLSATILLERLRVALLRERVELAFDYFLMHRVCWKVLLSVEMACQS